LGEAPCIGVMVRDARLRRNFPLVNGYDLAAVLFHAGRVRKEGAARRGGRHYKRHQKEWFPLNSCCLATQKNLVMKTAAAREAGAAPSIIKTNVSGIGVAGAIVIARVGVGAGVRVASGHARPRCSIVPPSKSRWLTGWKAC